jgi:hypothetical protein
MESESMSSKETPQNRVAFLFFVLFLQYFFVFLLLIVVFFPFLEQSPEGATKNDLFDSLLNLEEQIINEGFEKGMKAGEDEGREEGFQLGFQKGDELGTEFGHYLGCARAWRTMAAHSPSKFSERSFFSRSFFFSFIPSQFLSKSTSLFSLSYFQCSQVIGTT